MITFNLNKKLKGSDGDLLLDVNMHIKKGQFVTLYGDSGAGKTSILRMLAGLMIPDKGKIEIDGQVWFDASAKANLKPRFRKAGFVFQNYALFPNMTVRQNLEYALEKGQDNAIIDELIDIIELRDLQDRKPETLSGGQKQRTALARALVRKPEILMLDEPLSALDREMRIKLQDYIIQVHRKYELTTILVSHDISEIFRMTDRVFMLEKGKIAKQGTPEEIFTNRNISGKFQFTGEVVKVEKADIVYILSILIGNNLVKVVVGEEKARELNPGDKVLVASKAFNPIVYKL
ncbi:MAG: ATP-binding cassette domain-containing protein [Bacteroidota bacterium]